MSNSTGTKVPHPPVMTQHRLFDIVVILKGLNGLVELVAGAALIMIPAGAIANWADLMTRHELSTDPNDVIANLVMHWAANFGHGTQVFAAIYLLLHGVAKSALAGLLLLGQKIAYPIALVFFSLFVVYALYRLTLSWSWVLAIVVAFDIIAIIIIAREWQSESASFARATS